MAEAKNDDGLYEWKKGVCMFAIMGGAICFNTVDQPISTELHTLYSSLSAFFNAANIPFLSNATAIQFITFKWIVTAMFVNVVTIIFAAVDIYRRPDRDGFDLTVMFILGFVIAVHFISLPFTILHEFDFNYIVLITYGIYVFADVVGLRRLNTARGKFIGINRVDRLSYYPIYYYPLACLDIPSVLVILLFIWYTHASTVPVPKDFYDGVAAGILVFSGFVYAGLLGFVIPERRIHLSLAMPPK